MKLKPWAGRRANPADTTQSSANPAEKSVTARPLEVLASELERNRMRRSGECDRLAVVVAATVPADERIGRGKFHGHEVQALDTWCGRDFTVRRRAVGWSWLPFVDAPEHVETDETRSERFDAVYSLDAGEKRALDEMTDDVAGRIAHVAGLVAARIRRYPAWKLDFFTERGVRVDLAGEVGEISTAAAELRELREVLGEPPAGPLRDDPDVVGVYIEKARLLDRRADGLLARLTAFVDYLAIIGEIQLLADKQAWLDKVNAIDDLEHGVRSEVDRHEADRIRNAAADSSWLANQYLPTLEPLTASLTVAETRG